MPLLETRKLVKDFGGIRAINGISLCVEAGEIVGIIGPNGSGKTTFVNLIMGIYRPDVGQIFFQSQDITGLPPETIAQRGISKTFQISRPFAELSVLQNMLVAGLRLPKGVREERALALLQVVNLLPLQSQKAGELSFGQTKLLEFARVLMLDPQLILLDEPVAGVHPRLIAQLENVIQELRGKTTFLIIEHNVMLISKLCDRVVVFNEGEILTEGSIHTVQSDPRVQEAYFG